MTLTSIDPGIVAAALPYCDAFVSGHTSAAMTGVFDAIGGGTSGRSRRR